MDPKPEEVKSYVDARELAAKHYKAAADLVQGKDEGDLSEEELTSFSESFDLAKSYDDRAEALAPTAAKFTSARERLDYYHTKATGQPVPWGSYRELELPRAPHAKSMGQLFVESDEYTGSIKDRAERNSRIGESDRVSVKAATDVIGGSVGSGLRVPDYLPGILPLPQRPLTVRELFSQDTTDSDTISYAAQSAFDNAAAAVAEATSVADSGAKPQSSIAWTRRTSTVETIATWMAATRKQLADAGQTRSLIDNQLRLMLALEEEDQLINGNGTSPNLRGILNVAGIQTLDLSAATSSRANLDGLRTARRLVATGAARAQADAVILNPVDSEEFDLMVDGEERYRAGDPFASGPAGPSPIWRMRRVESEAVAAGTAIVGACSVGATVFEREGIVILTSDSHEDYFTRNLVAVLAEERLGFAVYFPAAFVEVTLDAWPS
jgi:HK97 family phage major capsid protein